jgi:hypothetical protein
MMTLSFEQFDKSILDPLLSNIMPLAFGNSQDTEYESISEFLKDCLMIFFAPLALAFVGTILAAIGILSLIAHIIPFALNTEKGKLGMLFGLFITACALGACLMIIFSPITRGIHIVQRLNCEP